MVNNYASSRTRLTHISIFRHSGRRPGVAVPCWDWRMDGVSARFAVCSTLSWCHHVVTLKRTFEKSCRFFGWLQNCQTQSRRHREINIWTRMEDWTFNIAFTFVFFSDVGMATTVLNLICFCYCCCSKCCHKRCPKFSKWWKDNPCTTIIVKPKIVTSIHSSRESVKSIESRARGRIRRSLTEATETTELVCLNTDNKGAMPTGKR